MYFRSLSKYDCSGCSACKNSCPKECISMIEDSEGFLYPQINKTLCVRCGLCEKVCPFEHPIYGNSRIPIVYAALLSNVEERQKSSSGGIFYSISKWVISNGGIVFGATITENLDVYHIGIDSIDDLYKLRGSKYVQSLLDGIFIKIKDELIRGRLCYFVGTGCQVAGLKSFLRKEYDNLITSDLVCHGVPSQKLFREHIQYLENMSKDEVLEYSFRSTREWKISEEYLLNKSKKRIVTPSFKLSPYLYSFMYGYTYRYSCYNCKFACVPRQGDITLADFWGIENFFPEIDCSRGASLILVNTKKGESIWNNIKDECEYYRSTLKDGGLYNHNLEHVTSEPAIRGNIYQKIQEYGYEKISKDYFRPHDYWFLKIKYFVKNILKKFNN